MSRAFYYTLAIIPLLKPSCITHFEQLDTFFDLWRVVSIVFGVCGIIYSASIGKFRKNGFYSWYLAFCIYMIVVTLINQSSIKQYILICVAPLVLIYWVQSFYECCGSCSAKVMFWMMAALCVLNMLSIILTKNSGIYIDQYGSQIYVLGMRTRWTDVFLPVLGLLFLVYGNSYYVRNFTIQLMIIGIILYQILTMWIVTAIIGICVTVAVYYIGKKTKIKRYNTLIFTIFIIFNVSIVFFRIHELFGWLISGILHKSLDLNSRTMIWDTALLLIRESPVIGFGITENTSFVPLYGGSLIAQGHSLIIQLLHDGGIIGLILFLRALYAYFKIVDILSPRKLALSSVVLASVFLGVSEIYFYHIYIYVLIGLTFSKNLQLRETR